MSFAGIDDSLGYQQITVTAVSSIVQRANVTAAYYIIKVEAQAVRWRDDGTDPTTTVGMPLAVGETLKYDSKSINNLRFIAQTAGGIINVTAYGKNP